MAKQKPQPKKVWWLYRSCKLDEYDSLIVVAANKKEARVVGKRFLDARHADYDFTGCDEDPLGRARAILASFNAG